MMLPSLLGPSIEQAGGLRAQSALPQEPSLIADDQVYALLAMVGLLGFVVNGLFAILEASELRRWPRGNISGKRH
jgi:hypothetical protein